MTLLQSLTLPTLGQPAGPELYFRLQGPAVHLYREAALRLDCGGVADLTTYFNACSVGKWRRHTNVRRIEVELRFRGALKIDWQAHSARGEPVVVQEDILECEAEERTVVLALPDLDSLEADLLAPRVTGLRADSRLLDLRYVAREPALRDVRLGMVITHFNRQKAAGAAVDRLATQLLDDPRYRQSARLLVVDNSCNLPVAPHEGVAVLPNRNLGGSGGFARGLLAFDTGGWATHCLFMDDDASCEVESIRRTVALLAHAVDERAAVAGAMLLENQPHRQHESGARFDGAWRPNRKGLDMRKVSHLVRNEEPAHADYGAWWFFAFPIAAVRHYPFPFFVRGDDICFGLQNRFEILTLNGIASWQDEFGDKNSPTTSYLDARYHLLHALIRDGRQRPGDALKPLRDMVESRCRLHLYESVEACLEGLADVMQGPSFWPRHIDMKDKRARLQALTCVERPAPVDLQAWSKLALQPKTNARLLTRLVRWLTVDGLLFPAALMRSRPLVHSRERVPDADEVFRYRHILHYSPRSGQGFVASFSFSRRLALAMRYLQLSVRFRLRHAALRRDYLQALPQLTSREFWSKVYQPGDATSAPLP